MIERKNLFSIPFYKKTHFMGTYQGMHYKIEMVKATEDKPEDSFLVTIWPGPYCMAKTPETEMEKEIFPFGTEGLDQICDWLNEQYEAQTDRWRGTSMWDEEKV